MIVATAPTRALADTAGAPTIVIMSAPPPHLACSTTKCVIPLYHLNVGTVCATSILAGDDSYKTHIAARDYDGDLEGNVTD